MTASQFDPPVLAPQLADVAGVADILNCSTKTVRRMVDAGKIPGVIRLGRLLRFDLAVLSRWSGQGCPPPGRFDRTRGGGGTGA